MQYVKCVIIDTEFVETNLEKGTTSNPFYDLKDPIAKRIDEALKTVFDGTHCPSITHTVLDVEGYIVVSSEPMTAQTEDTLHSMWLNEKHFDSSKVIIIPNPQISTT